MFRSDVRSACESGATPPCAASRIRVPMTAAVEGCYFDVIDTFGPLSRDSQMRVRDSEWQVRGLSVPSSRFVQARFVQGHCREARGARWAPIRSSRRASRRRASRPRGCAGNRPRARRTARETNGPARARMLCSLFRSAPLGAVGTAPVRRRSGSRRASAICRPSRPRSSSGTALPARRCAREEQKKYK